MLLLCSRLLLLLLLGGRLKALDLLSWPVLLLCSRLLLLLLLGGRLKALDLLSALGLLTAVLLLLLAVLLLLEDLSRTLLLLLILMASSLLMLLSLAENLLLLLWLLLPVLRALLLLLLLDMLLLLSRSSLYIPIVDIGPAFLRGGGGFERSHGGREGAEALAGMLAGSGFRPRQSSSSFDEILEISDFSTDASFFTRAAVADLSCSTVRARASCYWKQYC